MVDRNDAATFVLIHGGGSSSWDWHLVSPELRGMGHAVLAVDLPIEDESNGIAAYAEAVAVACRGRSNLVVVAHSWGGLVAPVVCSLVAAELLVFVAGMVPRPGETPSEWWSASGHDELGISFAAEQDEVDLFFNGVSPELIAAANAHARDQSAARWNEPSPLTAWPDVPTRYLLCRDDRFFPPAFARAHALERLGVAADEIDGGHMVALSRPRELAEQLHHFWTAQRR